MKETTFCVEMMVIIRPSISSVLFGNVLIMFIMWSYVCNYKSTDFTNEQFGFWLIHWLGLHKWIIWALINSLIHISQISCFFDSLSHISRINLFSLISHFTLQLFFYWITDSYSTNESFVLWSNYWFTFHKWVHLPYWLTDGLLTQKWVIRFYISNLHYFFLIHWFTKIHIWIDSLIRISGINLF